MEDESPRRLLLHVSSYLLVLAVCLIDFTTGYEMRMGTLYPAVVAIVSWHLRPRQLVVFALATTVLWSGAEYLSGVHFSRWWLLYWNAFNHLGVVTIIALLVANTRATLNRQRRLIRDLGQTLLKVSQFKELVPICRLCHEFHVDDKYRARIEELVQEGADMEAIGDVCPACLTKRAVRLENIPVEKYFQTDAA